MTLVATNRPKHLVRQKKLKRTFEHLARHLVANLRLVLVKLNGLWPVLVPLVTRQTMKVTTVGTRFPKTPYLPVRFLMTARTLTVLSTMITASMSRLTESLQSTTTVLSCMVLTNAHPSPSSYLVSKTFNILTEEVVSIKKTLTPTRRTLLFPPYGR